MFEKCQVILPNREGGLGRWQVDKWWLLFKVLLRSKITSRFSSHFESSCAGYANCKILCNHSKRKAIYFDGNFSINGSPLLGVALTDKSSESWIEEKVTSFNYWLKNAVCEFSTFSSSTMHHFYPPNFCIIVVCNFSSDMKTFQGTSKAMPMQFFLGGRGVGDKRGAENRA